jgi:hypothetical protein
MIEVEAFSESLRSEWKEEGLIMKSVMRSL